MIVNRTDPAGLGLQSGGLFQITDIELPVLQTLWSGGFQKSPMPSAGCFASLLNSSATSVVNPIQREPMSGTFNTFEFTNVRCSGDPTDTTCNLATQNTVPDLSQESGVGQPTATAPVTNPLDKQCTGGGGSRMRAIGTSEMVGTAVHNTEDSIGYTFFSYGNVSKIAGSTSWGYLTLDGVDGIVSQGGSYTTGELPVCTSSGGSGVCPASPGTSSLTCGTARTAPGRSCAP